MEFWKYAFNMNWINAEVLRKAVRTLNNPSGEITPQQYREITAMDYV